jgi:hypothetical protein
MGGGHFRHVQRSCIGPEPISKEDASMFEDDRSYYQHRAEVEIERAQLATVPSVVQAHYQLAEAYFGKLASDEPVKVEAS